MKVAIIGCGTMGIKFAQLILKEKKHKLIGATDIVQENITILRKKTKKNIKQLTVYQSIAQAELIIECAHPLVLKDILKNKALDKKGKQLLVMSTGGLLNNLPSLKRLKHCQVHVPSGAIAGLDAIKAVRGKIKELSITTTKPPKGIAQTIKKKTVLFKGSVKEAVKKFPKNINVAASLFLASQFSKIKVTIVADPKVKLNTHEIMCKGSFGTITTKTENKPSTNPKTSYLAVLSGLSTLKKIID